MKSSLQRSVVAAAVLAVLLGASGTARAGMMLTPAGMAQGFVLTTFADGFPNGSSFGNPVGPVGIAVLGSGQVMVSSYTAGSNAVFATDTDGQHYSGAALSSSSFFAPSGLAISGGNIYQALQGPGTVIQVDGHGNFVQTIASGIPFATGLVTNPTNGHLIASNVIFSTVYDINPVTNAKSVFLSGVNFDGLAFSRDGSILYGAVFGGNILGYNTSTKALVFDSGFIPGAIDGIAVGTGVLANNLFVNTHDGRIIEINLTSLAQTTIAAGGSRGDLVSPDPNGSLLLTQTDSVLRLSPPPGGGFGGAATPEPASLTLLLIGAVGMAGYGWRQRGGVNHLVPRLAEKKT
jgi:hypothetical protein